VLRETTALASGADGGHGRTHSLDDEYASRLSPDVGGSGSGSGGEKEEEFGRQEECGI
jgi:hypothetical protein